MDIRNLNVIPINIKLLGEKIIKTFLDIEMDNDFFYMTPKVQATESQIDKCDYIKLKAFSQ